MASKTRWTHQLLSPSSQTCSCHSYYTAFEFAHSGARCHVRLVRSRAGAVNSADSLPRFRTTRAPSSQAIACIFAASFAESFFCAQAAIDPSSIGKNCSISSPTPRFQRSSLRCRSRAAVRSWCRCAPLLPPTQLCAALRTVSRHLRSKIVCCRPNCADLFSLVTGSMLALKSCISDPFSLRCCVSLRASPPSLPSVLNQ